jgi:TolA-binding protein
VEAKAEYGNLLRNYPDSPYVAQTLVNRSAIFIEEKKYQRALNDLERVLLIHPFSTAARDAKFQIAQAFFEQNDFTTAIQIFEETSKQFPAYPKRRPAILFQIAESFYQVKRYPEALANFLDVVNLFPTHELAPKAVNRAGDTYIALGQKKSGVRMYASTLQRYPDKEEILTAQLKLENVRLEDPDLVPSQPVFKIGLEPDPLKVYQGIIQKAKEGPDEMEAYYRKSLVYRDQAQYGEAVLTLKTLLEKYPKGALSGEAFEEVRYNLFQLIERYYAQEGFFVVLFTYVDHFDPFLKGIVRPDILVKIADSFRQMGLWDRALETYDRVLENDPEKTWNEHVELNKSRIHLEKDQFDDAEKSARLFTFRYPQSPLIADAEFLLAEALYAQNRFGEAVDQFHIAQDVLRANPPKRERGLLPAVLLRVPYYEFLLANAYKSLQRNNLAVIHYQRAVQSFRDLKKAELELRGVEVPEPFYVVQSRYQIVDSLYLMDQYRRAIQEARETLDQYPEDPNASWLRYIVSASYRALHQDEDSGNELKELLAKDQTSIVSKVAESKIQTQEWEKKNRSLFAF